MPTSLEHQREFIGLITQHQASLRAYIISLMPGLPGAADVLQETNLILWEKRGKFEAGSNFIAWSFSIARFEVQNHKRKVQKTESHRVLNEELVAELSATCIFTPQESDSRIIALEHCLSKLNVKEYNLIKHRYHSNESLMSYSQSVGRPVGSLRVTLHRIRTALRGCIDSQLNSLPRA